MNSTELKKEIRMRLSEVEAEPDACCMNDTNPYIQMVFDSILFNCLGIKEQIEDIRKKHCSFFSTFSNAEKEFIKETDEEVWCAMDSIWLEENSWCCAMDFEDDVKDWIYVEYIYETLVELIEYAEKTYGVFHVIDF